MLRILAGHHHRPDEDSGHAITLAAVVLVERHDEKAVIRQCPLHVTIQVLMKPVVALLDRAVMHVVAEIRYHE